MTVSPNQESTHTEFYKRMEENRHETLRQFERMSLLHDLALDAAMLADEAHSEFYGDETSVREEFVSQLGELGELCNYAAAWFRNNGLVADGFLHQESDATDADRTILQRMATGEIRVH